MEIHSTAFPFSFLASRIEEAAARPFTGGFSSLNHGIAKSKATCITFDCSFPLLFRDNDSDCVDPFANCFSVLGLSTID